MPFQDLPSIRKEVAAFNIEGAFENHTLEVLDCACLDYTFEEDFRLVRDCKLVPCLDYTFEEDFRLV